jgi:hypothetical protein
MAKRHREGRGVLTSFGTITTAFELARLGFLWTVFGSVVVGILVLAGIGLGLVDGRPVLTVLSAVVFLVGAGWTGGSMRSSLRARRLERRSRPTRASDGRNRTR